MGKSVKNIAALTNGGVLLPDGVARELKAIRALAAEVDPTLEGLLVAAKRQPALTAEAVIIEALKPLGLAKWRELFAGLNTHRSEAEEERVQVVRRALLRLWAVEAPEEAMAVLANRRPGEPISDDAAVIVASQLLTRGYEHAAGVLREVRGVAAYNAWGEVAAWCVDRAPDKIAEALDAWRATAIGSAEPPRAVMEKWALKDPAAAQQWADSQKPWAVRRGAMNSICEGLARTSISAARSWIESVPDETMRAHMQNSLVSFAVYQGSPAEAAELLPTINPDRTDVQNGALLSQLAERWVLTDQKAALAWAAAEEDSGKRAAALRSMADALTETAKTWAEVEAVAASMPDEASRMEALTRGVANLPPAEAAAHLDQATGDGRFQALHHAITGDPPLPLDQMLALVPEYARMEDAELESVVTRLIEARGPEAAVEWAASLPDESREKTMRDLYTNWATSDPEAALAASLQTADPELRQRVAREALGVWINEEPAAATEWLSAQPHGPVRDAGAAEVARSITRTDPAGALTWAASIEDEQTRRSTLNWFPSYAQITESWRAAVEASPLSAEEKSQLLKPR